MAVSSGKKGYEHEVKPQSAVTGGRSKCAAPGASHKRTASGNKRKAEEGDVARMKGGRAIEEKASGGTRDDSHGDLACPTRSLFGKVDLTPCRLAITHDCASSVTY